MLQELIKNTDKKAPDRCALQRALEEMQDLSLYVNEVKRDNEALQLILDIQNSIVDLQMVRGLRVRVRGLRVRVRVRGLRVRLRTRTLILREICSTVVYFHICCNRVRLEEI